MELDNLHLHLPHPVDLINYDSDLIHDSFTSRFSEVHGNVNNETVNYGNSEIRIRRNLEDLMFERSEPSFNYYSKGENYESVYAKIRQTLYINGSEILSNFPNDPSSLVRNKNKYIDSLKLRISEMYQKKLKTSKKIENLQESIKRFTDVITDSINFFNEIDYDPELKKCLTRKLMIILIKLI